MIVKVNKTIINIILILFFSNQINSQSVTDTSKIITITAVGDIMMGTAYPTNRLPPNDGKNLMKDVNSILSSTDITFGNLEGALLNNGKPKKECNDPTKCYFFRSPTSYVQNLKTAGFNLISLANNHAFDFGKDGYNSTSRILAKNKILHAGKKASKVIWKQKGLIFGFTAFAPNSGCNDLLDKEYAEKLIKSLADTCDVVIVSFHGGAEGSKALHVTNTMERYYGENRGNVVDFAKSAIDAGADVIIGHGPHIPRALELYKNRLIAYSLGNFCTYKGFSIKAEKGLAPILQLSINSKGEFINGNIISAIQKRPQGPVLDEKQRALKLIKRLTNQDINNKMLIIKDDGSLINNNNVN